jgi:NAD kinase
MRAWAPPRVVVVTRRSEYELLVARHGTREQARFFLERQGRSLAALEARHAHGERAQQLVDRAIPARWRRSRVDRADLSRYLFEPTDLIVAVGQDGLVANTAKYLGGQPVIGVNPDPAEYAGVLVRHPATATAELLEHVAAGRAALEARTMVEARLDDGQRLLALNEIFLGHRTHQSARYSLRWRGQSERQSSSGVVVATGTGATGWALSISRQRREPPALPGPEERRLAWFAREPWPSVSTQAELAAGELAAEAALEVVSEMNDDGVLFGDGIEDDRIAFAFGRCATLRVADERLQLVRGAV